MRLRSPRLLALVAALCAGVLGAGAFLLASWVDAERERAGDLDRVVVVAEELFATPVPGVTLWLPDEPARDVEPFAGRIYVATSSGLAVFENDGRPVRRYTTLDGLPENGLTCLERFEGKLYVGTTTSGLLAFDGDRFTRYRFERPRALHVSALCAVDGELLVGTFDGGLFEFDGDSFGRRYAAAFGDAGRSVTALLAFGPRLYVGTFDAGLLEWREGSVARLGETEGLGSRRVVGLAVRGEAVVVATDLGVSEIVGGTARLVDRTANAAGVAVRGGQVFVASMTSGVALAHAGSPIAAVADRSIAGPGSFSAGVPARSASGLVVEDGVLWALTDRGLFACVSPDGPARFEPFGEAPAASLSAGHVSALAIDGRGRLLVGYFDAGVDVLERASGERVERLDDPALREINAFANAGSGKVWIASSKGVAAFDGGRRTDVLGEREGLIGESASAVCPLEGTSGLAVATSKGVTVFDGAVARSLSAFHGLPNNHTYALAELGGRLYVGTLGGLAVIDGVRVTRVFTAANSALPHNWVNALAVADGRVYVGTYGGGVAELMPTGEIVHHEETAGLDVNPGAMLVADGRLYVGTLGAGVHVLDLDSRRWSRLTAGLASQNVTAIAADAVYLYIGTEGGIARVERTAIS